MADLSVNLGGLKLKNPLLVASADIGCHLGQIKEAEHCGAGAFITKGCIPKTGASGLTRKARFRANLKDGTLCGIAGFRRLDLASARELIKNAKKEVKIPIGANIFVMHPSEEEKEIVTNASKVLYESGADFIELDTTGNLPVHFGETEKGGATGEFFIDEIAAKYPGFVYETIRSVKAVVDVPVMGKVAYENLNVPALIQAMEKAEVDIIDIGNSGMGVLPGIVDIYDPKKMTGGFESADKNLALCLTGGTLRMASQAYLIRSAKQIKTPILGCGGISNWKHVVEAIMCGATAAAICTAFMVRGYRILKKMNEGLTKFMDEKGYTSVTDFRSFFLDKVAITPSEINVYDAVAKVDSEKCDGCGLCTRPAHCGLQRRAITLVDKKAVIEEAQCIGCETCASICPVGAITMDVEN
jgi:dihydropyrimidine dehydrogenase (NAD+) subunit PreA